MSAAHRSLAAISQKPNRVSLEQRAPHATVAGHEICLLPRWFVVRTESVPPDLSNAPRATEVRVNPTVKQLSMALLFHLALGLATVTLAGAPDWQPPAGLQNTMIVHAQVRLPDASYVSAAGSRLAVFKDDAIRGAATIYNGPALQMQFQLSICANATSETGLTLRVYDAASDTVYDLDGTLAFAADTTLGTIVTPQEFTALPVGPVNHPPVATAATVRAPVNVPCSLSLSGTDADGDPLTFRIDGNPAHGALSGFDAATGTVTYTSTGTYTGTDSFTFSVSDTGARWSTPATVSIAVQDLVLATINVTGGNVAVMEWGAKSGATPGADNGIDYLASPAGMDGRSVSFIAPVAAGTALKRDVRGALIGERWQIQAKAGDLSITFDWDSSLLPPGNWTILELSGRNGMPVAGSLLRMADVSTLPDIPAHQTRYFAIGEVAPVALASVAPAEGSTAGGTTVTLIGSGFQTGAQVRFGDTAATAVTLVDSTTLTAVTPAHGAGVVAVTVNNADGGVAILPNGYTYSALSRPRISLSTSGVGTAAYVGAGERLVYTIYFENLATATAPAQKVVVTEVLDANLDLATLALTAVGFNNVALTIPAGQQTYAESTTVTTNAYPVDVTAALNPGTGIVQWVIQSVDRGTGMVPADPLAGFLPPNDGSHRGEGFVSFSIKPKAALPTATVIRNQASTVFDLNPAITSNQTVNTLDTEAPVLAPWIYRSGAGDAITVSLAGSHGADASGVASFDVYVSTGTTGVPTLWGTVSGTTTEFPGTWGERYSFFIQARDTVGNLSAYPASPQAVVQLPQWAFAIAVTHADVPALFAAVDSAATTGWDPALDEEASSAASTGDGRCFFVGTNQPHSELTCECLPPAATVAWVLYAEPGTKPLVLDWNRGNVPADKYLWLAKLDAVQGFVASSFVDLGAAATANLTQAGTYLLTLSTEMRTRLDLKAGWNLLSLPLSPLAPEPDTVFGSTTDNPSHCWRWQQGARSADAWVLETQTVQALTGYWVFSQTARSVLVAGTGERQAGIQLQPGWNLIGPYADSTLPPTGTTIVGAVWGWDAAARSYRAVPQPQGLLRRGQGYWVRSSAASMLHLTPVP